jgi:hypothetical protein
MAAKDAAKAPAKAATLPPPGAGASPASSRQKSVMGMDTRFMIAPYG